MPSTSVFLLSSIRRRRGFALRGRIIDKLPAMALVYAVSGEGTVKIDGIDVALEQGQLLALAPGSRVEVGESSPDADCYLIWVERCERGPNGSLRRAARHASLPQPLSPGLAIHSDPPRLLDDLRKLEQLFAHQSGNDHSAHLLLQKLLHELLAVAEAPQRHATEEPQGIAQSIAYIHSHYNQKIKLDTLAALAGFTPTSYSREFKKSIGVSPVDYLNTYRIGQAKQLLLDPGLSVKETAACSGFGSEFYFSRIFKRETGYSPSMFLKRKQLRIAAVASFPFGKLLRSLGAEPVAVVNCHKDRTTDPKEHPRLLSDCLKELQRAEPELIICDYVNKPYVQHLKAIAPTLIIERNANWRIIHHQIAAAIGRENIANDNCLLLDKKMKEMRGYLRERFGSGTVSYMRFINNLIRIQGKTNHPLNELIYEEIGLKPGYCVHDNLMNADYSPDKYPALATDYLLIQRPGPHSEDEAGLALLQATPRWRAMLATGGCRIYMTDNWVANSWFPLGRIAILEQWLHI